MPTDYLTQLEDNSIYIIREAYFNNPRIALLWSIGKDSTALLWMCRRAFLGDVPFPVIHIDTGYKFPEMLEFRDRLATEWGLNLIVRKNESAISSGMNPDDFGVLQCCHSLKTEALSAAIKDLELNAILLGIRRDEHGVRAKERYFSPRKDDEWKYKEQPPELWDLYSAAARQEEHLRVHPLLHMSEQEVWEYVQRENIPLPSLYFSNEGHRYRSLGCQRCCQSVPSSAVSVPEILHELEYSTQGERAGRSQDKEEAFLMQKLRSLGYM